VFQNRRQHLRTVQNPPLLVRWGESQTGFLVDLCEGGLAVDGLAFNDRLQVIRLEFDLPEGHGHIQTSGEIAWISNSGHRAGVRFADLAETSRQQLRKWISASAEIARIGIGANTNESSQDALVADTKDFVNSFRSQMRRNEELRHNRRSHYLTWFIVGVFSLISAGIFVLRHLKGAAVNQNVKAIPAAQRVPGILSTGSIPSPGVSPEVISSLAPARSLDFPGFVVQVAAMKHEDNADALAEILHQRNFPAFVFKRVSSPLYRVVVGVYSDADSALRVKDGLTRQGFEPILKRWSTE
jgi:SPOR domain/PilZ domain